MKNWEIHGGLFYISKTQTTFKQKLVKSKHHNHVKKKQIMEFNEIKGINYEILVIRFTYCSAKNDYVSDLVSDMCSDLVSDMLDAYLWQNYKYDRIFKLVTETCLFLQESWLVAVCCSFFKLLNLPYLKTSFNLFPSKHFIFCFQV